METTGQAKTGAAQSSRLANWSLFLGLFGFVFSFVFIGVPFAIAAIFSGHVARTRIKHAAGTLTGKGKALVGLIGGYSGVSVLGLMLAISSAADKMQEAVNGNACIANLRQIDTAKKLWAQASKKAIGDTPTFRDLKPYLPQESKCPKGGQYKINAIGPAPECSIPGHKLSFRDPSPISQTNAGTNLPDRPRP